MGQDTLRIWLNGSRTFAHLMMRETLDLILKWIWNILLHDAHDNFPMVPETLIIEKDILSDYQTLPMGELGLKAGGEKLCFTLNDKPKPKVLSVKGVKTQENTLNSSV